MAAPETFRPGGASEAYGDEAGDERIPHEASLHGKAAASDSLFELVGASAEVFPRELLVSHGHGHSGKREKQHQPYVAGEMRRQQMSEP